MRLVRLAVRHSTWLAVLVVAACGSTTTTTIPSQSSSPAPTRSAAVAATSAPTSLPSPSLEPYLAGFELCPRQPGFMANEWLCDTVDVPLDRTDASAGTIPLAVYVLPHLDTSVPAGEPVFTTPGGPGGPAYENYGLYAFQGPMRAHHDIVTVDPRGTGESGLIDCPDPRPDSRATTR